MRRGCVARGLGTDARGGAGFASIGLNEPALTNLRAVMAVLARRLRGSNENRALERSSALCAVDAADATTRLAGTGRAVFRQKRVVALAAFRQRDGLRRQQAAVAGVVQRRQEARLRAVVKPQAPVAVAGVEPGHAQIVAAVAGRAHQ